MFKLHRPQCNSCLYLTETFDVSYGKPAKPICGFRITQFRGETKTKCNSYEFDKCKAEHGIPSVFANAFKDGK